MTFVGLYDEMKVMLLAVLATSSVKNPPERILSFRPWIEYKIPNLTVTSIMKLGHNKLNFLQHFDGNGFFPNSKFAIKIYQSSFKLQRLTMVFLT